MNRSIVVIEKDFLVKLAWWARGRVVVGVVYDKALAISFLTQVSSFFGPPESQQAKCYEHSDKTITMTFALDWSFLFCFN